MIDLYTAPTPNGWKVSIALCPWTPGIVCKVELQLETLKDRPCYGGIDLSTTQDLSAFALVWPPMAENDKWAVRVKGYCPEGTVRARSRQDRIDYSRWIQEGHITATPGNVIDYEFIKRDALKAQESYDIREVGYDPWNATQIVTDLSNNHGLQMVEVRQGANSLSEPAKSILTAVLGGALCHGRNPALRWCVDNLVMVPDANENIRPVKDKSTDRIDLFVARLIAWSRAMANMDLRTFKFLSFV